MYFGLGPFGIGLDLGNNPRPQQQNRHFFQQPQQQQQGNNQGGLFNLFNNFMNPFFPHPPQQNQQQAQNQPRPPPQPQPSFFRKNNEKPKQQQNQSMSNKTYKDPSHGNYWKAKGNESYQNSRYEQAIEYYTKAIEINNTESVYYSNRAQALKKLKKLDQALKDAQEAIQLDTDNARGHMIAGRCLAEFGKQEDNPKRIQSAITRLTKALTLSGGGKRLDLEKQSSRYIYLAKKVLFYIRFNEVRNGRLQALQQYRVLHYAIQSYLEKDTTLDTQTKQLKMQSFLNATDEQLIFTIPQYLICRITFDLMEDPVVTDSGQCYDRTAIQEHMQKNGKTDPFTRQPIKGPLYPCVTIKKAIHEFLDRNPWAYEYTEGENYKDIDF